MGNFGAAGVVVCKRWRAARLMLMLEKVRARRNIVVMKDFREAAMAGWIARRN